MEKIRTIRNADLADLIARGSAAVENDDWRTVRSCGSQVGNILAPEVASQNDKKRMEPHLLEFLLFDFSPELSMQLDEFRKEPPPAIAVSFSLASDELALESGILATATGDLNLDGKPDIVVVRQDGVEVLHKGEVAWESLASFDQTGLTGVCVVDLDRDAVKQEHCWEADPDLIAFGPAGVFILENVLDKESGSRSLVARAGDSACSSFKNVLAILPVDFDHDGDLDLVVSAEDGMSTWLNLENWTFANHSQHSQLPPASAKIHMMVAVDWDRGCRHRCPLSWRGNRRKAQQYSARSAAVGGVSGRSIVS